MVKKNYIIILAGGKGTRLKHNTWNKPKCLVPILGKPILYHCMDFFKNSNFILIGDYHFETLKSYIKTTRPNANLKIIKSSGTGSIAGIYDALKSVPNNSNIYLIWSDLFFVNKFNINQLKKNVVGITNDFFCRYIVKKNKIVLNTGKIKNNGVVGFFYFPNKKLLQNVDKNGEFVDWFSAQNIKFSTHKFNTVSEIGEDGKLEIFRNKFNVTRYFNELKIYKDFIIKKSKIKEFNHLISGEKKWYIKMNSLGFTNIPKIFPDKSLKISKIIGKHPDMIFVNRDKIIENIFATIEDLHSLSSKKFVINDLKSVYYSKTISRVESIQNMIPNFEKEIININGINCKNFFSKKYFNDFKKLLTIFEDNPEEFNIIHGDPTFSNIMVNNKSKVHLIDPRLNFGNSKFFGDPLYDWAKLYYSVVGSYDNFNKKKFVLRFVNSKVEYYILDNGWSIYQNKFEEKFSNNIKKIKLLHSLIWLSLSGYVKDDYDSILTSFYKGTYLLNEFEKNYN